MHRLLSFTSTSSEMTQDYYPPIELDPDGAYGIAMYSLNTYNTIPNVIRGISDTMTLLRSETGDVHTLRLPEGSYELEQIASNLQNQAKESVKIDNLEIFPDYKQVKMRCASADILFLGNSALGKLMGFSRMSYAKEIWHSSDIPVSISSVNEINVDCSLAHGSYRNGHKCHTLYSFYPDVAPGYKIVERPSQLVYLPINLRDEITHIAIRLVNQHNQLINFRGEEITIQLDLKKF